MKRKQSISQHGGLLHQQPQTTTNKAARTNLRAQFNQTQTLRRSRSKQAPLIPSNNNSSLLSADQLAHLSVDQILAKYKLGQLPNASVQHDQANLMINDDLRQPMHNGKYQKKMMIHQSDEEPHSKVLPKHRIKQSSTSQSAKHNFKGVSTRKTSHGPDQFMRSHQQLVIPQFQQSIAGGLQDDPWQAAQGYSTESVPQEPHNHQAIVTPQQKLASHHKRYASGQILPSFGPPRTPQADESFIHNQVFRALDKILNKANQTKQANNGQEQNHINQAASQQIVDQQNMDLMYQSLPQTAAFGHGQQRQDETPNFYVSEQGVGNDQPHLHHNHHGFQTSRSDQQQQIFFSHQAPAHQPPQLQQPLVQLNSSYMLPPQTASQTPPAPSQIRGAHQNGTRPELMNNQEIQQLKSSTQALTQEVNEMRSAIQAIRQGNNSLTRPQQENEIAPMISLSATNTDRSNVTSSRASPAQQSKQQIDHTMLHQPSKAVLDQLMRERDEAQSQAQKLAKEAQAHKYTVQSLKDAVKTLETDKGLLIDKLEQSEHELQQLRKDRQIAELPKEIHSPPVQSFDLKNLKQLNEEQINKIQKDCQLLSQTVTGQASRIRDQENELKSQIEQLELIKSQLEEQTTENLKLQEQILTQKSEMTEAIAPIIETKEVIKYVENPDCQKCQELGTQIQTLEVQIDHLQKQKDQALQEKIEMSQQIEQITGSVKEVKVKSESEKQEILAKNVMLEKTVTEMAKQIDSAHDTNQIEQMKSQCEAQVQRMDKRCGDAVKKIKAQNLDIAEYKEIIESKDYEIKMLQESKQNLSKVKGKKNQHQQVINQLNDQVEKDVQQIMEGRTREAALNKLVAKLQQDTQELRQDMDKQTKTYSDQ